MLKQATYFITGGTDTLARQLVPCLSNQVDRIVLLFDELRHEPTNAFPI